MDSSVFKALSITGGSMVMHAKRVSSLSVIVAKAMHMNEADIKHIEMAGLVHDIGQLAVDRRVLLKSEKLEPREYESVKIHPVIAEELLSSIK
ncbi:MAG TPA: HD domain-containing protein [Candidatus Omnitrophica bacterium]|nr:HD domain-containing protein [Candidatus Omnitrophota bacterium]